MGMETLSSILGRSKRLFSLQINPDGLWASPSLLFDRHLVSSPEVKQPDRETRLNLFRG